MDCNGCKHINLTEADQVGDRRKECHVCQRYNQRLYHMANTPIHPPKIYPCKECVRDNFESVEPRADLLYHGCTIVVSADCCDEFPVRHHRKARINKKWRKVYGVRKVPWTDVKFDLQSNLAYMHPTVYHQLTDDLFAPSSSDNCWIRQKQKMFSYHEPEVFKLVIGPRHDPTPKPIGALPYWAIP